MRFKPLQLAAALIAMNTIVVGAKSGDRIFYLEGNGKGARDPEIWAMDLDTSNRARLDAFALVEYIGVFTSGMDVSPDGLKVVYSNAADAEFEICMINSDGSDRRQLTNNPGGRDVGPRFTRNGRGIIFASSRNGSEDLYVIDIDSGDLTKLTDGFASRSAA